MKVLTKTEVQGCVCIYNLNDLKHGGLVAKTLRQFSETSFKDLHKFSQAFYYLDVSFFFCLAGGAPADVPVAIIKEIYAS